MGYGGQRMKRPVRRTHINQEKEYAHEKYIDGDQKA